MTPECDVAELFVHCVWLAFWDDPWIAVDMLISCPLYTPLHGQLFSMSVFGHRNISTCQNLVRMWQNACIISTASMTCLQQLINNSLANSFVAKNKCCRVANWLLISCPGSGDRVLSSRQQMSYQADNECVKLELQLESCMGTRNHPHWQWVCYQARNECVIKESMDVLSSGQQMGLYWNSTGTHLSMSLIDSSRGGHPPQRWWVINPPIFIPGGGCSTPQFSFQPLNFTYAFLILRRLHDWDVIIQCETCWQ